MVAPFFRTIDTKIVSRCQCCIAILSLASVSINVTKNHQHLCTKAFQSPETNLFKRGVCRKAERPPERRDVCHEYRFVQSDPPLHREWGHSRYRYFFSRLGRELHWSDCQSAVRHRRLHSRCAVYLG